MLAANQFKGAWNVDGKGPSVAGVASYKPHVKNYAAHAAMSDEAIAEAMATGDTVYYGERCFQRNGRPTRHGPV